MRFCLLPLLRKVGSMTGRRRKTDVSLSPSSSLQKADFLPVLICVEENLSAFEVLYERTEGDGDDDILSALSAAKIASAALAVARIIFGTETKFDQIVFIFVADKIHAAAASAVAAVRSAGGLALVRFE